MINKTFIFFAGVLLAVLALSALLFAKGCGKGKVVVEDSAQTVVVKTPKKKRWQNGG